MKILAVITDNFKFYHDVVKELKHRDIPFISLSPRDEITDNVKVVLTTEQEKGAIDFDNIVPIEDDIRKGVRSALSKLSDKASYDRIIIGIDPGSRPGVAILGDGRVLETEYAENPEDVRRLVERYITGYRFNSMVIRIGHGDKTNRNRTINALGRLGVRIEIVNEERTTSVGEKPDLRAAKEIALTTGELAFGEFEVEATEGEKREIQRRSRIKSEGTITISKDLAKKVVEGEIDLGQAIKKQKEKDND